MNKQEVIKELMSKAREITFGEDDNVYLSRNRTVELISQIDEPQKVVVPKFVAEWIEECKDKNSILYFAMNPNRIPKAVNEWLTYDGNDDVFARAWLDGYEVEQEKMYTVKMKNAYHRDFGFNEMYGNYSFYNREDTDAGICFEFTKSKLEQAGFGGVFDNDMFEVEEVTK